MHLHNGALSLRLRVVRRVAHLKHGFLRDGEECADDVVGGIGIVGFEGPGQHVVVGGVGGDVVGDDWCVYKNWHTSSL